MEARACDSMNPKKSENNKQACLRVKAQNKNKKNHCVLFLFLSFEILLWLLLLLCDRETEREREREAFVTLFFRISEFYVCLITEL